MWPFPFIPYYDKTIGCKVSSRFQKGIVNSVMRMNELEIAEYRLMLQDILDFDDQDHNVAFHAYNARARQISGMSGPRRGPFTQLFATIVGLWGAMFNASLKREARQYFKDQNNRNR